MRENIDYGTVVNLIKSIYAMREHRDTLIKESLDNSIEMVVRLLEFIFFRIDRKPLLEFRRFFPAGLAASRQIYGPADGARNRRQ